MMGSKQTWQTGEDVCRQLGGHLADVSSEKDLQWLWELVNQQPFWIGMRESSSCDSEALHMQYLNMRSCLILAICFLQGLMTMRKMGDGSSPLVRLSNTTTGRSGFLASETPPPRTVC